MTVTWLAHSSAELEWCRQKVNQALFSSKQIEYARDEYCPQNRGLVTQVDPTEQSKACCRETRPAMYISGCRSSLHIRRL